MKNLQTIEKLILIISVCIVGAANLLVLIKEKKVKRL